MKLITSKDNAFIKSVLKLKTKKGRLKANEFILDGYRIVKHALENDIAISSIIMTEDFYKSHDLDFNNIVVTSDAIMKTLVETETPQGILAIVKIEEVPLREGPVLFLDKIQDPGNLGTLIRTAEAAGFGGVILRKGCTDPYSQKSIRSSMGSIVSIPVLMGRDIDDLMKLDYKIYGAALEGGKPYRDFTYDVKTLLIIGNEGNGITDEVLDICHERIYIPMKGDVESLNASIAGGILMFEIAACVS
ncbi:RNA methyltransferase [Acidaminobacter sp. JC074]|uniref:TrmH family RNA methyltransferase n=1 Tax=Acidaminobacter sp. JC074 TaxID=2530199 RepID=UPI001F0DDF4D|nr:RNA methyltransferase [Acidaminobacter sp. JC074]